MTKLFVTIISLAMLSGCAYFNVTRTITLPDKTVYTVNSRKDDLVSFEKNGLKVMVDGRGRPGMIEQALGIMFMNFPDVNLEK